jgi:capsular polysaccharide export protein
MKDAHFLFLQGMQSSFFKRVGDNLTAKNCRVSRINFCLGDWIFWSGKNSVSFRGRISDWKDYIDSFLDANGVTDIILVGEQRKYHDAAIIAAKERGIRVVATDFGYLRPDWIAIELNGMNGSSLLPRNIEQIHQINNNLSQVDLGPVFDDGEIKRILCDLVYSFSTLVDVLFFPYYVQSDMRPQPAKGLFYSFIKWGKLLINYSSTKKFVDLVGEGETSFFLFAMQLEHDFQIVKYSHYNDLIEPIEEVVYSFSKLGNNESKLIFKNHPCDLGIRNWTVIIAQLAMKYGIDDRVYFIDGGVSLDKLLKNCSGLVTVNSTSGLRSLQLGCPVKSLSSAIYSMPGLTFQGDLDDFWEKPIKPDQNNVAAFVNVIASKLHIRGLFFNEPGMSGGIRDFADKLVSRNVGI